MSKESDQRARCFLAEEGQFRLGFLPTEQSSPLTRGLDKVFAGGVEDGVACLQRVDRNVLEMSRRVFCSSAYQRFAEGIWSALCGGGRVVFSGCGATGRLSVLLETIWRDACVRHPRLAPYADRVSGIITGGDYALVKSVESFEDFESFGRRQIGEFGLGEKDVLVAITEGGETSSVLGTVFDSVERGVKVFLLFNNPAELLAERLERSRRAIRDARVCVLDLSCGPMALAGSTRMQATTSEQLVAGAALEGAACRLLGLSAPDAAADFALLLDMLESDAARHGLAQTIDFESSVYRHGGLVTYFAEDFLLDIFTDTTERSPTFMLPPFRKSGDFGSPQSWAFVKCPVWTTEETWEKMLHRQPRCLEWTAKDYADMGAPVALQENPPALGRSELMRFQIGREAVEERIATGMDAGILVMVGLPLSDEFQRAFNDLATRLPKSTRLAICDGTGDFRIPCHIADTPLRTMRHLAVKLVLNTISTGTMAVLGRITGNWMSWVNASNKKLIDRATRLVAELGGIGYDEACHRVFAALEESADGQESPVQRALRGLCDGARCGENR